MIRTTMHGSVPFPVPKLFKRRKGIKHIIFGVFLPRNVVPDKRHTTLGSR